MAEQLNSKLAVAEPAGDSVDLDNLFAFLSDVQPNRNQIIDEIGERMNELVEDLDVEGIQSSYSWRYNGHDEPEREQRRKYRVEKKLQELEELQDKEAAAAALDDTYHDIVEFAHNYFNSHERSPEGTIMATLTRKSKSTEIMPKYEMVTYYRGSTIPNSHIHMYDPDNVNVACSIFRYFVCFLRKSLQLEGKLRQYVQWCADNCKNTKVSCRQYPPSTVEIACDDFPVNEKVALQLAGLQAQVALGEPKDSNRLEYYSDVDTYLPQRISRSRTEEQWTANPTIGTTHPHPYHRQLHIAEPKSAVVQETLKTTTNSVETGRLSKVPVIAQAHRQYGAGRSELTAKVLYLSCVMQYPLYGTTMFQCKIYIDPEKVSRVISGESVNVPVSIDVSIVPNLKFAPLTSVSVERSFSAFKMIFSDKRQRLTVENLEKILVVYCADNYNKV
ncbi:hypothetical protein ANN_01915 [Periplaneta americana]|uniref:FERM central domain-containing protein n=1 Tax=Periplaneta americana TaxID=6978 RepID=A0ABQ8TUU7_PERAM|nr:hypothetical protein ANN_01915 [Periplaneta americana]